MKQKVWIVGANGAIGFELVKIYLKNGFKVVASSRDIENSKDFLRSRGAEVKPKSELLPANALVNSNDKLVWYQPSRITPFWHVTNGERCGFNIKWPAMVFAVGKLNKQFRCVALASDERPDANSPVYDLPMPNAYHGGGFCLATQRYHEKYPYLRWLV